MNFLINFIRFSRLHTIIGTTLSIIVLYLMAWSVNKTGEGQLLMLGLTLLSCLGANIYIVGLNQITDVEIDKINKPYLPLASGAFSKTLAYVIITISIILSLGIAFYLGQYLLWTVLLSLLLGTAYSLPPIRLKRFSFWAAFCIIAVRGLIVNILLFLHFHALLNGAHQLTPVIVLLTITIFIYSIIIAWFKDIPDMEGDRRFNIQTLSIQLGAARVFKLGNLVMGLSFVGLMLFAYYNPALFHLPTILISHFLFLLALLVQARKTDLKDASSIKRYYLFIWVLFFGEYIVFGLSQLLP